MRSKVVKRLWEPSFAIYGAMSCSEGMCPHFRSGTPSPKSGPSGSLYQVMHGPPSPLYPPHPQNRFSGGGGRFPPHFDANGDGSNGSLIPACSRISAACWRARITRKAALSNCADCSGLRESEKDVMLLALVKLSLICSPIRLTSLCSP